ncbi:MAG: ribonuclease HII [Candidatus Omnitrophica bacterium]|nr:ribonuclease HII [Candidatus Omnitrophota bacterium]
MIVGVDEAGRGPLAGVVVACALHLRKDPPFEVKDSKLLSARLREEAFSWLIENSQFRVGIAEVSEIDKFNILEATFLAFNRAIRSLLKDSPALNKAKFIIDGPLFRTDLSLDYLCMKGADRKVREVSCASIMAKVTRDHLMKTAHFLYPEWNFSKHKGYPTSEHFSLIKKYQLSPLHRRSFNSTKAFLK